MNQVKEAIHRMLIEGINPNDIELVKSDINTATEELIEIQRVLNESFEKAKDNKDAHIYLPILGSQQQVLNSIYKMILNSIG